VTAVAVDLGGTFLRCAVASDDGVIRDLITYRIDRDSERVDPEALWSRLFGLIQDFAGSAHAGLDPADPIAFAFPGPIFDHARSIGAPTLIGQAREMPDIAQILRERTGRSVFLLNDVSAAAWYFLSVERANRFMVVTVSSGIGSKIADRRHPDRVLDRWVHAGEIGHVVVDDDRDAPICDCGGRGHLGAISSGRGTENLARRMAQLDADSFARSLSATSFGATQDHLTNEEHLVPAALAGDAWAWKVVREAQAPLAGVLATTIVAASLEKVLIIGGFAASIGDPYITSLCDAVQSRLTPGLIDVRIDKIIACGHSAGEACLRGAGLFAASIVRTAS
jgi:predicted NBD/HSP70 family sugar kinase